jgi:hypothetical protein
MVDIGSECVNMRVGSSRAMQKYHLFMAFDFTIDSASEVP